MKQWHGRRVAMRTSDGVTHIHGDHLGSATNTTGPNAATQRYFPWGARRSTTELPTPYRFTGQREESTIGLYFYNARWYDPALGRFTQPDTLVPEPGNPQALNRYAYTRRPSPAPTTLQPSAIPAYSNLSACAWARACVRLVTPSLK